MNSFKNKSPRRIESVLDINTGQEILASDFFTLSIPEVFKIRYETEILLSNRTPRYVCYFCRQPIKIRGQKDSKRIFHFAHLKDSDECPIKTDSKFTKEEICCIKYNGAKESEKHLKLKDFIATRLSENMENYNGIEEVAIEAVIKSIAIPKTWKKPDISTTYKDSKLVFELQLSTTFLSEIASRQEFYKNSETFILWVFNKFETNDDERKFTCSDVFYSNNFNGFELDEIAIEKSLQEHDLILKCYYQKHFMNGSELQFDWKSEYVRLSDLTFDQRQFKIYFYDVIGEKERLEIEQKVLKDSHLLQIIKSGSEKLMFEYFLANKEDPANAVVYIKDMYKKLVEPISGFSRDTVEYRIVLTILLYKLYQKKLVRELEEDKNLLKTIVDILCLKLEKMIGYNYKKQIEIAHQLLQSRPEHLELYLSAIKQYFPNLIEEQDRSNRFRNKVNKLRNAKTPQSYNSKIIQIIFPELDLQLQ